MHAPTGPTPDRRPRSRGRFALMVACLLAVPACGRVEFSPPPEGAGGQGQGPGGRPQPLALSPRQELELGRKAYREILSQHRVVREGPEVERVRRVGRQIVGTTRIRPLMQEMNLRAKDAWFEWEFNVLRDDRQVNAFCLPGGKVGVFTGMLRVARDDDFLATVLSHEIAHALAHHASERLAVSNRLVGRNLTPLAVAVMEGRRRQVDEGAWNDLLSLFGVGGPGLSTRAYEREQESEADHVGVFLMTFAGYDPAASVEFWQRMRQVRGGGAPPEFLSTHPSDERRIEQLRIWVKYARAAREAYEQGRIAPGAG